MIGRNLVNNSIFDRASISDLSFELILRRRIIRPSIDQMGLGWVDVTIRFTLNIRNYVNLYLVP